MKVPFLDLVTPHVELERDLTSVLHDALTTAGFIGGPRVEEFERNFAEFCGTRYSIGVSSGTDALRFALMSVGIAAGDTVITVPNTFIATTEAISQAGARIAFVDVHPETYTLDPARLKAFLEHDCTRDPNTGRAIVRQTGSAVAAVLPVHLYGQMADMDPIVALAAEYNFAVVEDACQAHGAEYYSRSAKTWQKAGSVGRAAAFSFYPGKNLGACGEGGAITTNDEAIARRCRMLREHGQSKKYYHDIEGYNGRLDAIQAGFLTVKLRHLAEWNEQRRQLARGYDALLAKVAGVVTPVVPEWSRPVFHLYVIQTEDRDGLMKTLGDAGIGTGIHYPVPLHLTGAYQTLGLGPGSFPISERLASHVLSLPMFPNLSADAQREVVAAVQRALSTAAIGA